MTGGPASRLEQQPPGPQKNVQENNEIATSCDPKTERRFEEFFHFSAFQKRTS
jgi:hypothetical protein